MRLLATAASIVAISCPALASNPRGDDLKVGEVDCRTYDFELPPELKARAIEAKNKIIEEGRFGVTRTIADGIVVSLSVKDDILWLTGIGISGGDGRYTKRPTVIPTDIVVKPIRADWFSGELIGYHGRLLRFHVREFGFVFEVTKGRIMSKNHLRFQID